MKVAFLVIDNREAFKDYDNPMPHFGTAPEALLQGFAELPDLEIHVISCVRKEMQSPVKLADNIFFHALPVKQMMRTLYWDCVRATRKKLKELQPDIVHGQGTERDSALCAAFSGFPNVVTIHGNMKAVARFYKSRIFDFYWLATKLEDLALKKTAGVFCNSAYTENLVAPRATKTWRVPNALRKQFFEYPPISNPVRSPVPVLVNVGIISPYKQQLELLALARKLWKRNLRFEIHFIGATGTGSAYSREFARELEEAEKIGYARHLGMLSTMDLINVFDKASAIVHVPAEEAFGLVVAEALARNLKLFGFATGGVTDIGKGVEGVELAAAQDWGGMENSIARWIESGCPRPQTAAQKMCERYEPGIIARRHREIYQEVLRMSV